MYSILIIKSISHNTILDGTSEVYVLDTKTYNKILEEIKIN